MKKLHVQCPICNKVDKIENNLEYKCSYCSTKNKIYECKIKNIKDENREIEYLEECLKKSIISYNKEKTEKYINLILFRDKNNHLATYFMIKENEKKIIYLLNNEVDYKTIYFIIKNDVLKNKKIETSEKEKILEKYSEISEVQEFKKQIHIEYSENKELCDSLYKENIDLIEYTDPNKQKYIALFAMISSIVIALIVSLVCTFAVYDDCVYGTIVLIAIVPNSILVFGINKYFNIKNIIIKIFIYIIIFYCLTYLMTIHLREVSFINSFYDHIKHIVTALPEVLESITKNSNMEWGEKE